MELMLSSGNEMISSGANVVMLQSGANVIIWCYHVMLSSGMITPPPFYFSWKLHSLEKQSCLHYFLTKSKNFEILILYPRYVGMVKNISHYYPFKHKEEKTFV
jgi:hypothetical protein